MLSAHLEQRLSDAQQKHKLVASALQEQVAQLAKTVQLWEHRYQNREPREEDLRRIAQLASKLDSAQEKARKARQEMSFYKQELVNRETSYNKVFSSQVHVGVLSVLPEPLAEKDKRKSRRKEKKQKGKGLREKRIPTEFPPLGRADACAYDGGCGMDDDDDYCDNHNNSNSRNSSNNSNNNHSNQEGEKKYSHPVSQSEHTLSNEAIMLERPRMEQKHKAAQYVRKILPASS
jgi:hypothetical protein